MIATHQPTIFGDRVIAGVSSVADGSMKFVDRDDTTICDNISRFVAAAGLNPNTTTYMGVTYDTADFARYATTGLSATPLGRIDADGIATNTPGATIFLPLADCTGAIFYDPTTRALMVSHLGRHSTEQFGARKSVEYLRGQFDVDPADLLVWLGLSPNGGVYPIWARDNMSLIEANRADLLDAGVAPGHIEVSAVDTAHDDDYFSHSEFLKGHREQDGRFAIVAALR